MENPRRSNSNRGFEENLMAIIDSSGVKESHDLQDDRAAFLEAVRVASLISDPPYVPSWKISESTFKILKDSKSLELAMVSYQLLTELDKCYPRVYLTNPDKSGTPSSGVQELVVEKEAWLPFNVGSEAYHGVMEGNPHELIDSSRFSVLIEDISQTVHSTEVQLVFKNVEDMLLFRYLVNTIEADFLPRRTLYGETLNWVLLSESILNMLLVSRKLNFKGLVRGCMSMVSDRCHHHTKIEDLKNENVTEDSDFALAMAITELEKETCTAVQNLLTLIIELDVIRKEADLHGLTSRVDGLRIPLVEVILDELTYNKDQISPFLTVFSEPRWKLEIILQYFSKYCMKPSVRTRRSTESSDVVTFKDVLTYFATPASTKNTVRKISSGVAQVLLAHAFQAYLSGQHDLKVGSVEKIGCITLREICHGLISAFQNLIKYDKDLEVQSFEKEALFTAATILSREPIAS